MTSATTPQKPINIAVLTVSDTRTLATDKSGATLIERLHPIYRLLKYACLRQLTRQC